MIYDDAYNGRKHYTHGMSRCGARPFSVTVACVVLARSLTGCSPDLLRIHPGLVSD